MSVSAEAMMREAASLDRQGRVGEAIDAYQRVLTRWPGLPDCWYNLALLQRKAGEYLKALTSYQHALERGVRRPEEVHLNRALIFADYLRQTEAAERELQSALTLNPVYLPALLNLANLHEDMGRRDVALALYDKILALDPDCLTALARYATAQTIRDIRDPLIGRLQRAISEPGTGAADRASLGFALGQALDRCGAYAAAFAAYAAANRASRDSAGPDVARYDRAVEEHYFDRLLHAFPVARRAPAPPTAPPTGPLTGRPTASPVPIFVCGMFRSGSTLMEQVLARHSLVVAGGELELLPRIAQQALAPFPESLASVSRQRLEVIAARYLDTLAQLFPGASFVIDKRPDNFLYIGLIKLLLPQAKIVHTTREPLDNCLSIFFLHLDQRMSYALDLMDIGHHYVQYRRLMAHWKALYGADIFDVSYDSFVREPQTVAEPLFAFLGLEWDDACLAPAATDGAIKTASVWQARVPIYRTSSGRARHYRGELAPLRAYLEQIEPT